MTDKQVPKRSYFIIVKDCYLPYNEMGINVNLVESWKLSDGEVEIRMVSGNVLYLHQETAEEFAKAIKPKKMNSTIPIVIIESPYKGNNYENTERNMRYLRAAMRDCLLRGEAPFASHALYTQEGVLDDKIPEERAHGITAGFAFRQAATKTVVYDDLGISGGMQMGIDNAKQIGHTIEHRSLGSEWKTSSDLHRAEKALDHTDSPCAHPFHHIRLT
jgi:hypothetical protein